LHHVIRVNFSDFRLEPESKQEAAAEALLNRGWGRPAQMTAGDDDDEP
jgi:hypothetical protein